MEHWHIVEDILAAVTIVVLAAFGLAFIIAQLVA